MMTEDDVLKEFRDSDALLEGHFILSSGLHSGTYLDKSLVFMYPERTERLCSALAKKVMTVLDEKPSIVVSPAVGGIIPGYETARALGVPSIFTEREDGEFKLRRGFKLEPGQTVVMVEDIVTTGLSSRECISAIRAYGGNVVAAACIIDRSGGAAALDVPMVSLAQLNIPAFKPDELPPELAALPAVKHGSRGIQA